MATRVPPIFLIALTAIFVWPAPALAGRPAVLVNPHVRGNGTATTIQEGIDMVDAGGKVMVLPGTYNETIVIAKGLTLEAVGGGGGPVVIAPPGTSVVAVRVATPEPVTIRGITVQFTNTSAAPRAPPSRGASAATVSWTSRSRESACSRSTRRSAPVPWWP